MATSRSTSVNGDPAPLWGRPCIRDNDLVLTWCSQIVIKKHSRARASVSAIVARNMALFSALINKIYVRCREGVEVLVGL